MNQITIYPNFGQITVDVTREHQLLNGADTKSILLDPLVKYELDLKKKNQGFEEGQNVIVVKDNVEKYGILRNLSNDYVDLEIDNVLCRIRNYSSILQQFEKEEDEIDRIYVESRTSLSYLFNQISWKPVYMIHLKDELASLNLNAIINTSQEIEGEITLIAGDFQYPSRALSKSENTDSSALVSIEKFSDYHIYNLGYLEIDQQFPKSIYLKDNIEVSKFYSHDINSKNIVNTGYSFTAPDFLPSGSAYVYLDSRYIGTFFISETQKDNSVELLIGPTSYLSCISNISIEEDEYRKIHIDTQIFNQNSTEVELTIRYYVGNASVLYSQPEITEIVKDFLEWDLSLDSQENYLFQLDLILSIL